GGNQLRDVRSEASEDHVFLKSEALYLCLERGPIAAFAWGRARIVLANHHEPHTRKLSACHVNGIDQVAMALPPEQSRANTHDGCVIGDAKLVTCWATVDLRIPFRIGQVQAIDHRERAVSATASRHDRLSDET